MKKCNYCGTERKDDEAVCPSCGASEFQYKCNRCGTLFSKGEFCPQCGLKIGKSPKTCPRCGAKYYDTACPECGYTPAGADFVEVFGSLDNLMKGPLVRHVVNTVTDFPAKKRKFTWLWILGWIFIFPAPLTVLMVKNTKIPKAIRIAIIIVGWVLYFNMSI